MRIAGKPSGMGRVFQEFRIRAVGINKVCDVCVPAFP